jgi:hypothetical protein
MTTSANTSWELTRNELIETAYRKLGLPGDGNTLSTDQYTDGATALNSVIALAVTDGMPLWKRTTTTVTPSTTSQNYTLANAVKVSGVFLRDTLSGVQYELEVKSLYDYYRLPNNTSGIPVNWVFEPTITGGTLRIWPMLSDSGTVATKSIVVVYQKKFDGFTTTTTDTLDFPSYWTSAIVYKTAVALAPEVGMPIQDRQDLKQEAKEYWALASSYGDEEGSLFIQPYTKMRG